MNYGIINKFDVINGNGIRVSLFVSGCHNNCKGCFNKQSQDFNYGKKFTTETQREILLALTPIYITGISILGGEPLESENISTVYNLCKEIKEKFPTKDIWLYTGYTFENISSYLIMKYIDVLVDGKYIEEQKDLTLKWRGSKNQRVIDVKESLKQNKVVLYCD